jgi:hypothetical protein
MPRIFWFIFVAMLASWLAMNLWSVPQIEELSGGLRLLDMRFLGYSFDEAKGFLAAIGDEGTAKYLGAQFWLDMIFPPLLGAVLFLLSLAVSRVARAGYRHNFALLCCRRLP